MTCMKKVSTSFNKAEIQLIRFLEHSLALQPNHRESLNLDGLISYPCSIGEIGIELFLTSIYKDTSEKATNNPIGNHRLQKRPSLSQTIAPPSLYTRLHRATSIFRPQFPRVHQRSVEISTMTCGLGTLKLTVSIIMPVIWYGSAFEAGRLSSKYP